jgi:hypothetical protein
MTIACPSMRWLTGRIAGSAFIVNTTRPTNVPRNSSQHSSGIRSTVCRGRTASSLSASSPLRTH